MGATHPILTPDKINAIALEHGMCSNDYQNAPLEYCAKFADAILAAAASGAAPMAWIERRFANDEMVLETINREPMSDDQRADLSKFYQLEVVPLVAAAALQQANQRADMLQQQRDELLVLLSKLVKGDVGQQTLGKLSAGQSTDTAEEKAWLAANALITQEGGKMAIQPQEELK